MCGIFGYFSNRPVSTERCIQLLRILELSQYEGEVNPIGGHGAGICFLDDSGNTVMQKAACSARDLLVTEGANARAILGHVRRASKDFFYTIGHPEATQPYNINCSRHFEVVSAHNGMVRNYKEIRRNLSKYHSFQSECVVGLVDSEVIPHLFEEKLNGCSDEIEAAKYLLETLEGDNALALLSKRNGKRTLHILHRGRTRGMHIWKNKEGNILLCSRKEPVLRVFKQTLENENYKKALSIEWKEKGEACLSFDLSAFGSLFRKIM